MMLLLCLALAADDPATEKARQVYLQAETQYKLGRFDDALQLFEKAYEHKPNPGFLFNIGQCHFQLKDYDRAIFFYEGFLREATPNPQTRYKVNAQLADARKELAKQQRVQRDKPSPAPAAVHATVADTPRAIVVSPTPTSAPVVAAKPAPVAVEASTPVYKRWWLWTIVGVVVAGGAAAAVTVVLLQQPKPGNVIDWTK